MERFKKEILDYFLCGILIIVSYRRYLITHNKRDYKNLLLLVLEKSMNPCEHFNIILLMLYPTTSTVQPIGLIQKNL